MTFQHDSMTIDLPHLPTSDQWFQGATYKGQWQGNQRHGLGLGYPGGVPVFWERPGFVQESMYQFPRFFDGMFLGLFRVETDLGKWELEFQDLGWNQGFGVLERFFFGGFQGFGIFWGISSS